MSTIDVDITSAWAYVWKLILDQWAWLMGIQIHFGPFTTNLFDLFISLIAILIIWEMVLVIFKD